jgi:hypothetical protein
MKASHIVCAILACAPLTLAARAAASSEDRSSSSVAAANVRGAGGRTAPSRIANTKVGRSAVMPQRGVGQAGVAKGARSNAGRVHSLLNAQAHGGRLARQPGRAGSTRAVTHGPDDVRGPRGVSPASQPKMAASNGAAPSAARLSSTPRNSAIGGPHAQGLGRVGGPAISRTTHSATIDGTQLRHKF